MKTINISTFNKLKLDGIHPSQVIWPEIDGKANFQIGDGNGFSDEIRKEWVEITVSTLVEFTQECNAFIAKESSSANIFKFLSHPMRITKEGLQSLLESSVGVPTPDLLKQFYIKNSQEGTNLLIFRLGYEELALYVYVVDELRMGNFICKLSEKAALYGFELQSNKKKYG